MRNFVSKEAMLKALVLASVGILVAGSVLSAPTELIVGQLTGIWVFTFVLLLLPSLN